MAALDPSSPVRVAPALEGALLSDATRSLLEGAVNARRLIDELDSAGSHGEAIKVIARVLPKQFALAWACECVRKFLVAGLPTHDADRAGLALAESWLRDPTEENRRAALDFAEQGRFTTVGTWVAAAAGWSGGSMAPADCPPVAPAEHLMADAIAAALALLAAQVPDEIPARQAAFVSRALETFGGKGRAA